MTYEIAYKCFLKCEAITPFPYLKVKVRKAGHILYDVDWTDSLDFYSYKWCGDFYKDYESYSDMEDFARLTVLKRVLESFGNDMDSLVKYVVKCEMCMVMAEENERLECEKLAASFVTNGWRKTTIELEENCEE